MKPHVKVLVAVWGDSYIEAFTRLGLPSLLAPGNLPALAEACELEVSILTSERDVGLFEVRPAFQALRSLCKVGFVGIDDLLGSSVYGITLTLAYMRGIGTEGENMVNVHFMFFNSDFILAEGSLRSLLRLILDGRRVVMAPTFRAVAEDIEPLLEGRVDAARRVLAIPPRELVGMALKYPHPTIIAKTLNQDAVRSLCHNQLYWRVDDRTILARFFLMFILCIRPERVVHSVDTYCDYGFAPELCPSGDTGYLTDSDNFFMLETQAREHEMDHIELGAHSIADIAGYLSEWTTHQHRGASAETLVFHSADLPAGIADMLAALRRHWEEIATLLPPPKGHAGHPYWVSALPVWQAEIRSKGRTSLPPELRSMNRGVDSAPTAHERFLRTLRRWLVGIRPDVMPWHSEWVDFRLIRQAVHASKPTGRRLAVVDEQSPITAMLNRLPGTTTRAQRSRLSQSGCASVDEKFNDILVVVRSAQVADVATDLIPNLLDTLSASGELTLIVHDPGAEFPTDHMASPIVAVVARALGNRRTESISVRYSSASIQRHTRKALRRFGHRYIRQGFRALPVVAVGTACLLLVNLAVNLFAISGLRSARQPEYCGAIILKVTVR